MPWINKAMETTLLRNLMVRLGQQSSLRKLNSYVSSKTLSHLAKVTISFSCTADLPRKEKLVKRPELWLYPLLVVMTNEAFKTHKSNSFLERLS
jgi:hypothetical protein